MAQIAFHNSVHSKTFVRADLFSDPALQGNLRIIADKPIQHPAHIGPGRQRFLLPCPMVERPVDLRKQFHANHQLFQPSLIGKGYEAPQLRVQNAQRLAQIPSQPPHRHGRISVAVLIVLWQNIRVQGMVSPLQLLQRRRLQTSSLQKLYRIVYHHEKLCTETKVGLQLPMTQTLLGDPSDSLRHQPVALLQNIQLFTLHHEYAPIYKINATAPSAAPFKSMARTGNSL